MLLEKNTLKAINFFDYTLEDDIYYHVFNLCNQIGISYNKADLFILYQTSTFLKLYTFFQNYFAHVEEINNLNLNMDLCITSSVSKNNQLLFMLSQF
jgi:hypothetical protein